MIELNISLIHYQVQYDEPEINKKNLLALIRRTAKNGADIILTPEMAISGYSFQSREDIAKTLEEEDGIFLQRIKKIAMGYNCYICVGLGLRDMKTGAYYNSAIIVGPNDFHLRYDKINGEFRWAKPGDPRQTGCFDSPWGKVGILICSDTYYELQPRIAALKGVDLLLVPANWPPSGLDPIELWRARALENGMAIAACNRTGQDLSMDCELAESCLIDADGSLIFRKQSAESKVFELTLPLENGKLRSSLRQKILSDRRPAHYHKCYRNIAAVSDLTSFLSLPIPGALSISCFVPEPSGNTIKQVSDFFINKGRESRPSLWILPPASYSDSFLHMLTQFGRQYGIWLLLQRNLKDQGWHLFSPENDPMHWNLPHWPFGNETIFPQIDIGPARIALIPFPALHHPEIAVAAAKDGCDMIVTSSVQFTDDIRLTCGVRTINHLAVALCTSNGAGIWMRPEGHERWGETVCCEGSSCGFLLDTALTRKKRFQDLVDFDIIFNT